MGHFHPSTRMTLTYPGDSLFKFTLRQAQDDIKVAW